MVLPYMIGVASIFCRRKEAEGGGLKWAFTRFSKREAMRYVCHMARMNTWRRCMPLPESGETSSVEGRAADGVSWRSFQGVQT